MCSQNGPALGHVPRCPHSPLCSPPSTLFPSDASSHPHCQLLLPTLRYTPILPENPIISTLSPIQSFVLHFLSQNLTGQNISPSRGAHFPLWQEGSWCVVGVGRIGLTEHGTLSGSPRPPHALSLCAHATSFTNPHTHTPRCLPVHTPAYPPLASTHTHTPTVFLSADACPHSPDMEGGGISSSASSYPQVDRLGGSNTGDLRV